MNESRDDPLSSDGTDRLRAGGLLVLTAVSFVAFLLVVVPRLSNVHFGDVEFTGWSSAMGTYVARGLRPYVDFVLPIPPGSFALLALVQKIQGRPLLLQELVLNEVIHLIMGVFAYVVARRFTTRKNAAYTAIATLITVWELNKECAYDHTAQLFAWGSLTAGACALTTEDEEKGRLLFRLAGLLAGLTLAFKQSTALGASLGFYLAFAYLAMVEVASGARERARAVRVPLAAYTAGLAFGLLLVWLLLVGLGSTARAFFEATFADASRLKGGPWKLVQNLFVYLFVYRAYPSALGVVALGTLVAVRLVRRRGGVHAGDEPTRAGTFQSWEAALVVALVVAGFGAAIGYLLYGPPGYPLDWVLPLDAFRESAGLGLIAGVALFVAHLVRVAPTSGSTRFREDSARAGHVWNAVALASLSSSLMHNTSAPEFRPFYDNNALIPLAFTALFVVLDRAELPGVSILVLLLTFVGGAGNKFFRATTATIPAPRSAEHWAGMRLNQHGLEMARAAARVRALAGPDDAVLVLPEDLELSALVGRPRPPLFGAIVFVDQYSSRLLQDDIARLDENPPKVVVVHPRTRIAWQRFFRIWSGASGAERLMAHVLDDLLPDAYELDSSFGTTFLWEPAALDVYVLKKHEPPRGAP